MLLWVGLKHLLIGIALLAVVLSVFFDSYPGIESGSGPG